MKVWKVQLLWAYDCQWGCDTYLFKNKQDAINKKNKLISDEMRCSWISEHDVSKGTPKENDLVIEEFYSDDANGSWLAYLYGWSSATHTEITISEVEIL